MYATEWKSLKCAFRRPLFSGAHIASDARFANVLCSTAGYIVQRSCIFLLEWLSLVYRGKCTKKGSQRKNNMPSCNEIWGHNYLFGNGFVIFSLIPQSTAWYFVISVLSLPRIEESSIEINPRDKAALILIVAVRLSPFKSFSVFVDDISLFQLFISFARIPLLPDDP